MRSWYFSFRDRKQRKRMFRRLWILRINAAARMRGINYSRLVSGLSKAGIDLNRKQLSELALHDPAAFDGLVERAKAAQGR
jgi:large subunit ribosomal protein L20